MDDPFSPERKTVRLNKQNLFGSGYAGSRDKSGLYYTHELIETSGTFCMHLIGEEHLDWVWRFGLRSGREFDKLAGLVTQLGATGSPILMGVPAWLDCRVEMRMDTGDRTIYLAEIIDARVEHMRSFLTRNRLIELAPAERLPELNTALAHDINVDGAAILAWRRRNAMGQCE